MKTDRAILIAFLGNYLVNTVLAAVVALVPASAEGGIFTAQYITFIVLSAVLVAVLAWWYGVRDVRGGATFGVIGFLVAIATAFVRGLGPDGLALGSRRSTSEFLAVPLELVHARPPRLLGDSRRGNGLVLAAKRFVHGRNVRM